VIEFADDFHGFIPVGTLREVFRHLGSATAEGVSCAALDGRVLVCDGLRIERGVCHVGRLVAVARGLPVVATDLKTEDVLSDDARRVYARIVLRRVSLHAECAGVLRTDPLPVLTSERDGGGEPLLELARLLKGPKLDSSWWPQVATIAGDSRSVDAAKELSELLAPLPPGLAWQLSHQTASAWNDVIPEVLRVTGRRFRHDPLWRNRLNGIATVADEAEAVSRLLGHLREAEPRDLPRVVNENGNRYVRRCVLVEERSESDNAQGVPQYMASYRVPRVFRQRKVGLIVRLEVEKPAEKIPVTVEIHDTTYCGDLPSDREAQVCIGEFMPVDTRLTIKVLGGRVKAAGLYFQRNSPDAVDEQDTQHPPATEADE
jgi:hypothetical protein